MTIPRSYLYGAAALVLAAAVVWMGTGVTMVEATATCTTATTTCYGLPVDDCIGWTTETVSFVPAAECSELANITVDCDTARRLACQQDGVDGEEWKEQTAVEDRSCQAWEEAYNLSLGTCSD